MRTPGGYWLRAVDLLRPPASGAAASGAAASGAAANRATANRGRLVSGGGTRGEGGSRPLAPGVCRGLEELRRQADRRAVLGRRSVPVPPVRRAGAGPGGTGAVMARRGLAPRRVGPGQTRDVRRRLP